MGNLFKYILAGFIGWVVWRWVKRSQRVAKANTAQPKQQISGDLAYCGVCNSYVSSDTTCGRGDCPRKN
jgi:hypothetical protein